MLVVQGKAVIAESGSKVGGAFTILFDNDSPTVINDAQITEHDAEVNPTNNMAQFDASDRATIMEVEIEGVVIGAINASLKTARAKGTSHIIKPPSGDVGGLPKEHYLREIIAFGAASVDAVMGVGTWESELMGSMTCITEITEQDIDVSDHVTLIQEGENVKLRYNATSILGLFTSGHDYGMVTSIEIEITGTLVETGAIGEATLIFVNTEGRPVTNGVGGLDSSTKDFITFDSGMHMAAGWLDGMEISYQARSLVSSHGSMYYPLFKYLFFSAVSPLFFSRNMAPMAFCGKQEGGLYHLPWVVTNNAAFNAVNPSLAVTCRGPELEGEATVYATEDKIVFDTANAKTSSGRVLLDLTVSGGVTSQFGISTFEAPCGIASGEFITSGVDCKISFNTLSNLGFRGRQQEASAGNLQSFHHMVNGFENVLGWFDSHHAVMSMMFGIMTRGISCALQSNTLQFVYYLIYEQEKLILGDAERNIMIGGINAVLDRHNANMGGASTNVPKELRKSMSLQYLEPIEQRMFDVRRTLSGHGLFTWIIFCMPITFSFPRSMPWLPTAPDVGIPLEVNILENAEEPDGLMTDDHYAMMKKNLAYTIFETRVDWILSPFAMPNIKENATSWLQMGKTIVLKKEGRHQELYAVDDNGYQMGDFTSDDHPAKYVTIPGEIGDTWNEAKESILLSQSRFAKVNTLDGPVGTIAEDWVENINSDRRYVGISHEFGVIDLDNESFIKNGESIDITILRPNKDIIIALKK